MHSKTAGFALNPRNGKTPFFSNFLEENAHYVKRWPFRVLPGSGFQASEAVKMVFSGQFITGMERRIPIVNMISLPPLTIALIIQGCRMGTVFQPQKRRMELPQECNKTPYRAVRPPQSASKMLMGVTTRNKTRNYAKRSAPGLTAGVYGPPSCRPCIKSVEVGPG